VGNSGSVSFAGKAKISSRTNVFENAASVTISNNATQLVPKNGIAAAASFVSTAQSATSAISSVLNEAQDSLERIQNTTSTREKETIASDISALFNEIDRIVSSAESNDEAVINAGAKSFVQEFSPGSQTENNTASISIPNIAVSTNDLGLDALTTDNLINDTEASVEVVTQAQIDASAAQTELQGSAQEIYSLLSLNQGKSAAAEQLPQVTTPKSYAELATDQTQALLENVSTTDAITTSTLLNLEA